ncbi:hypothetical protein [Thalassobaculum sp.]|uniref:AtuA-related protein n=1 Tax=Thalassobaculum sp. TaxID=2022740 RepID=UPI0032EBA6D0
MSTSDRIIRVPLHEVAHGRTGDKGNRVNISVIPYRDEAWPLLLEQLTPERVKAWFAAKGAGTVMRYELANLPAMNFVIDDVLQGGVNGALNLDGHGKSLAFHLLSIPVDVPERLALHPEKARPR